MLPSPELVHFIPVCFYTFIFGFLWLMGRDNILSSTTGCGLKDRDSICGRGLIFICHTAHMGLMKDAHTILVGKRVGKNNSEDL
jgi:hypothetical protein